MKKKIISLIVCVVLFVAAIVSGALLNAIPEISPLAGAKGEEITTGNDLASALSSMIRKISSPSASEKGYSSGSIREISARYVSDQYTLKQTAEMRFGEKAAYLVYDGQITATNQNESFNAMYSFELYIVGDDRFIKFNVFNCGYKEKENGSSGDNAGTKLSMESLSKEADAIQSNLNKWIYLSRSVGDERGYYLYNATFGRYSSIQYVSSYVVGTAIECTQEHLDDFASMAMMLDKTEENESEEYNFHKQNGLYAFSSSNEMKDKDSGVYAAEETECRFDLTDPSYAKMDFDVQVAFLRDEGKYSKVILSGVNETEVAADLIKKTDAITPKDVFNK